MIKMKSIFWSRFQSKRHFSVLSSCLYARGSRLRAMGFEGESEHNINTHHVNTAPAVETNISKKADVITQGVKTKFSTAQDPLHIIWTPPSKSREPLEEHPEAEVTEDNPESNASPTPKLFYNKSDGVDPTFSALIQMIRSKKQRQKQNLIILEGHRLIQDALQSGVEPVHIYFSRKDSLALLQLQPDIKVPITQLQYKQLQLWSALTTSPGVLAVFKAPEPPRLERLLTEEGGMPLTLVCDNIREPGNLGAILRVAAAAGCLQVLLSTGCVDLWDSKVLRAAAGAHFRLPVVQRLDWTHLGALVRRDGARVYLADSSSKQGLPQQEYCEADYASSPACVLVLGGETQGLSQEARRLGHCRLHIPLEGGVESLNSAAALAVILYEMRRHLKKNLESPRAVVSS